MKILEFPSAGGAPPLPPDWPESLHLGPAVTGGAVPRYLVDGSVPQTVNGSPETSRLEVIYSNGSDRTEHCDVVIVGSGAGGAPLAYELATAGLKVVVVEEGRLFTKTDFVGSPMTRFMKLSRDGAATAAIGNVVVPIPVGRTVGGTTTLNSGTCFRVPNKVLDQWEKEEGIEIDRDELDECFRRVEATLQVKPVPWELLGPNGWVTHYGTQAIGASGGPILRNISDCHGTGQCVFGCPTDAKQAMHVSYLPLAQAKGARIFAKTRVDWIETEGGTAGGVVATSFGDNGDQTELRIRARHVVISAGAIGTPLLLLRNKLANTSGQIGRNLSIHPATGLAGWFREPLYAWRGTLQQYYVDSLFDTHDVMIEATNSVPAVAASALPGFGLKAKEKIAELPNLATVGLLVSDTSRGRVRRTPGGDPLITYRLNRKDVSNLFVGLALSAEILLAAGADRVMAGLPGLEWVYDEKGVRELRRGRWGAGSLKLSAYHPMGTARMGRDPSRSVVSTDLAVHDLRALSIVDAGIFPTCLGVNPQMTIMAFALRAARRIARSL